MTTKAQIKKGNERLLELAEFLEALPPKRFDYNEWAGTDWKGAQDLSCGTTACALGWATAIPKFRKLGLVLMRYTVEGLPFPLDKVTDETGTDAAKRIFALTRQEAEYLFVPIETNSRDWMGWRNDYATELPKAAPPKGNASAKTVAKHIRRFVADRDGKL